MQYIRALPHSLRDTAIASSVLVRRLSSATIAAGAGIYGTDYDGALTLDFGEGGPEARREREHDAHYWRELPRRGDHAHASAPAFDAKIQELMKQAPSAKSRGSAPRP
jgi:hypothetical protein